MLKIGHLELLKELYSKLIIPKAVFLEIEKGKEKPFYINLSELDWIEVKEIANRDSLSFLFDLDDGEAETLILAKELIADLVIIDEKMGRSFAKRLGFNLTGTIGILLKAKEKKLVPSIKSLLIELSGKGTWINPKLMDKAIKMAKED